MFGMRTSLLAKCLALVLSLSLLIGQGPMSAAMAMPSMTMDQMPMMAGMPDMGMASMDQGCCTQSDKDHATKGDACGSCCVAIGLTALLSPQFSAPLQYAVSQPYGVADVTATGRDILPDPPRPKA
jgi:hypothetical protein